MRILHQSGIIRGGISKMEKPQEQIPEESEPKTDKGLFLHPFITEVENAKLSLNETKEIVIKGYHFDPKTKVDIPEESITVDSVSFIDPTTLNLTISAAETEGSFSIIVKNNNLDSGDSGKDRIVINSASWVDLRIIDLEELDIEKTPGVTFKQDTNRGIRAGGDSSSYFGRGVKFMDFPWERAAQKNFSFVFTVTGRTSFLFGIGAADLDVNDLGENPLFTAQIQPFFDNAKLEQLFGGGGIYNWAQQLNNKISIKNNEFYKVRIENSGANGTKVILTKIDPENFDTDTEMVLEVVIANNPAIGESLVPYWNAVSSSKAYITAFKIT